MAFHVNPLDALSMAIFMFEGARDGAPTTRCIRNNNPGNLRPYQAGQPTEDGYRYFNSFLDGWQALQADLTHKLVVHLTPEQNVLSLLEIYAPVGDANNPTQYAKFVCNWLSVTLGREITLKTELQDIFPNLKNPT
jgi:hypothetical protein